MKKFLALALVSSFVLVAFAADEKKPEPLVRLEVLKTIVVVHTPYNADFVRELKELPYRMRKWDGSRRAWLVELALLPTVRTLISKHYGSAVAA